MKLQDLLPAAGLPHTGYPENAEEQWFGQDRLDAYRRNGGHPLYGETSIVYRFNDHGYRSDSFHKTADVRILAIGCSWVLGVGIPEEAIFHQLFANRVAGELGRSVVVWNLGVAGAANDAIVRLLHQAVPELCPDIVLV